MRRLPRFFFIALAWLALATTAQAHKASDAYLQIQRTASAGATGSTGRTADELTVRWDIALRDLDAALSLDANADRKLSWGEVRAKLPDIQAYAAGRLKLQDGRCRFADAQPAAIEKRIDGMYLVFQWRASCPPGDALRIGYTLFREVDPTHRGLLRLTTEGAPDNVVASLDPTAASVVLAWAGAAPSSAASASTTSAASANTAASMAGAQDATPSFFRDGVHHILIGYDHILFLICLLLPSVMRRHVGGWEPVQRWQQAALPMLGIVTMFTLAHSITLALGALQIVRISPRIIEPAIALTIILAALDNIYPVLLRGRRKLFSFLFGLIHGFGFASVLAELDLPVSGFVMALLQFNLGVEAGQLVIVAIALVTLLSLRHWRRYLPVVLRGGSMAAVLLAAVWLGERLFDIKVLGFA